MSVEDLFRLIHAVNPTDRGLSPEAERRAYAQKSALQSLLIRVHGDVLRLTEGTDPDVVGLGHIHGGRDACHALVLDLDDDARAWVRQQRVEAQVAPPPTLTGLPLPVPLAAPVRSPVLSPLALGRQALEDWDYERAEACFRQAIQAAPGEVEPLTALLELWVDHLARDEEALALVDALPAATWRAPACRRYLVSAAVRLERDALARGLLAGLDHAEVPEVLRVLARRCVTRGELVEAAAMLATLRERDPAHAGTLEVEQALEQARAAARQPAEQALEALAATQAWPEVLEAAEELLRRCPASAEARRWRDRARAELDRRRAEALVAEAERLPDEEALRKLTEARALGLPGLDDAIEALQAQAAAQAREVAIAAVEALLSRDRRAGLLAALELAGEDRGLLLALGLSDLAALLDPRRTRRPELAVDALLALEAAEGLPWPQALPLLEPHRDWLRSLPRGRQRLEELVSARETELAEGARAALALALQAEAAGEVDRAGALLARVDRVRLAATEAAAARDLEARVQDVRLQRLQGERIEGLIARGFQVQARDLARQFAAGDPRWTVRAEALAGQVQAALQPLLLDPAPPGLDLRTWAPHTVRFGPDHTLHPDGEEIFLAHCHRQWLFVYALGVDSGRLRRAWTYRLPEPDGSPRCTVERDTLWIHAVRQVLALHPRTGQVQGLCRIDREGRTGESIVDHRVMPATGTLWTVLQRERGHRTLVHDARTGRQLRELDHVGLALPLTGSPPTRIALYTGRDLYFEDGNGQREGSAGARGRGVANVASTPDGLGYVSTRPDDLDTPDHPVLFRSTFRRGQPQEVHLEALRWGVTGPNLAALPEHDLLLALGPSHPDATLIALHGPRLTERWRASTPAGLTLLSDVEGRRAVLMNTDDTICVVLRLGPHAPDLSAARHFHDVAPKDMNPFADVLQTAPRPPIDAPQPLARAFLQHLVWGDHLVHSGRYAEAVEILDRPVVWRRFELQSRARLVTAWLELGAEPLDPALRWRRMVALAAFVEMRSHDLPREFKNVSGWSRAWTDEQLDALAARVREVLGA